MAVWLAFESWSDYRYGSLTPEAPSVEITFAQRGVPCVRFGGRPYVLRQALGADFGW